MIIAAVLRSGGEYSPEHVLWLKKQISVEYPFVCLSDVTIQDINVVTLQYNWPGWFSKMELFNPNLINDDILYFDLDTVIITSPEPYIHDDKFRMLSDFYHPEKPASGMMFIPHNAKSQIWTSWISAPEKWMSEYHGDQDVLERICGRNVCRFGSNVKSYKLHVATKGMVGYHTVRSLGNGLLPSDTDVVCFHGKPRPWDIKLPWLPELD